VTTKLRDLTLRELQSVAIEPFLEQDGTLGVAGHAGNVGDIVVSFEGDEISVK
jgi:hypothetical protein